MNDMTKQQIVLLVLLVSFVTALVTGIVSVALMSQAPQPITQTIQRVIEKTVGLSNDQIQKNDEKVLEASAMARDALIEDIAGRVSPAVVSVIASKDVPVVEQYFVNPFPQDDFFNQVFPNFQVPQYKQNGTERQQISAGSGFFVSSDGIVLTNRHVVEDTAADYTVLTNDGKKLKAKVLARDPLKDMAVLKVDGANYPFIPLGDSGNTRIGQTAIAIGNALGEFQNTVSVGVISGLKRTIVASGADSGPEQLSEVIQTDAAINLGNSGGPLLNLQGEAIALNTAVAEGAQNISFSIPINQIKRSLDAVKKNGKIVYPYIGVRFVIVTQDVKGKYKLSVDYGALVIKGTNGEDAVLLNSPASKAGIQEEDVILEFNGTKITTDNPLNKLIEEQSVGDKVIIKILHNGTQKSIDLTLEERKVF